MIPLAFDTETALIRPGVTAPELACVQWRRGDEDEAHVRPHTVAEPIVRAWLEDPALLLVGHNVAFDMAVVGANIPHLIPLVFAAYDADRVTDTMLREKLLDIAAGRFKGFRTSKGKKIKPTYDLGSVARRYGVADLDKGDFEVAGKKRKDWSATRYGYGALREVPFDRWPEKATVYAKADADATLAVYFAQEARGAAEILPTQFHEARADFALHLTSAWGLRTDPARVEALREATVREREAVQAELVAEGLVRADGSRDTKRAAEHMIAVCRAAGRDVELTEGALKKIDAETATYEGLLAELEGVALDADTCKETEDPLLVKYARFTTLGTMLAKDVKALAGGVEQPIHTHFALADSGRVTSAAPNVQNWKR